MLVLNKVSRYDVARFAIQAGRKVNPQVDAIADNVLEKLDVDVKEFWKYIRANDKGMYSSS
jgi:hypothetical protein